MNRQFQNPQLVALLLALVIFQFFAYATRAQILYSFSTNTFPNGLTQGRDGSLYGTTLYGGITNNYFLDGGGTIFSITTNGTFTLLYSFSGGTNGAEPFDALVQGSDGNFYGTTQVGGLTNSMNLFGDGTVFRITPDGTLTTLYAFSNSNDGRNPQAGLVQGSDGNLYGTTSGGGTHSFGTVFKISVNGALTSLYSFTGGVDGGIPEAGLVQGSDGNFYGTTEFGGAYTNQYGQGYGTIFRITTNGIFTSIYSFTAGFDGAYPLTSLVQGSDGYLYGTTSGNADNSAYLGSAPYGTIFRISIFGHFTILYSFSGGSDGANPAAALVQSTDGNLYGTTEYGGTNGGYGTIFKLTPAANFTSLISFTGGTAGGFPAASLVEAMDGSLYGTAGAYGMNVTGIIFRLKFIDLPFVTTRFATQITETSAMLNGMFTPNFFPTTAWFQWGINIGYGNQTKPSNVPGGGAVVSVSNHIGDLLVAGLGQPYHFRLVASNAFGISYGTDQTFVVGKQIWAWGNNEFGQTNIPGTLSGVVEVAGGVSHSLALNTDGISTAWGYDYYNQTNVPSGLNNVVALAGGYNFSVALQSNGRIEAWGDNTYGQINIPSSLQSSIGIAAGDLHCLALQGDGTVVAWGTNDSGQANIPTGLSNVVEVAAGGSHNLALVNDGTVVGWGDNTYGETNVPAGLSNVVAISAGLYHCLVLENNGTVIAWGDNTYNQIDIPVTASNVVAIAAGRLHSLALRSDGTLVSWGNNSYGQTNVPSGLSNVVTIAAGGYHNLALTADNPPVAISDTILDPSNSNIVISLSAMDPDNDPLTLRIVSLPSIGTLYQYNDGTQGPIISLTNTVVADFSNRMIFVPYPNSGNSSIASFQFVANDGLYDSPPATVTISMTGVPIVTTQLPAHISGTNAIASGLVTASFSSTSAWFQWGLTTNYGNNTSVMNLGNGGVPVTINVNITGLVPLTLYHYRIVATNTLGIAYGNDISFSTSVQSFLISNFSLNSSGTFEIGFTGTANTTYSLWASTNLINWLPIGKSIETLPGTFHATDLQTTNYQQRFYQLRWP